MSDKFSEQAKTVDSRLVSGVRPYVNEQARSLALSCANSKNLTSKETVEAAEMFLAFLTGANQKPAHPGYAEMLPHQQRVVDEKAELDEKLMKLQSFIDGPMFQGALPEDEQVRLRQQASVMREYRNTLKNRIAAF